ncbi:MAG: hypothetical protein CUN49_04090 [Candidatus Thermofonsia Clade 1 bacterium]|jgi:hypothetical protein|uniref:DUF2703 domain-containing protein n=2 Tax=Candidatus Thermofonsia Clade 1 bacterium TaxID=2364210 RepID=A0A2M8PZP9_9CHLR|nr:MAG: hypothetical protein CUN49_04090 [Candidatus Thermofonsia Clade 1 bacterium]PJF43003.1 MAG: hypothetical protein CUN50_01760 [Candidatus Thermofonsia Clade 1 bacterium]RMF52987.1 MAG: DUF2703 domain-containing protein [Chloroflexota bacterium]
MNVQFLYYEACPSHEAGLQRLREVMAQEGLDAPIEIIKVETEAQAEALRFIGSPTILINGADIAPISGEARYRLTCRTYRLEDGRFSPLPSAELIRAALQKAAAQP